MFCYVLTQSMSASQCVDVAALQAASRTSTATAEGHACMAVQRFCIVVLSLYSAMQAAHVPPLPRTARNTLLICISQFLVYSQLTL